MTGEEVEKGFEEIRELFRETWRGFEELKERFRDLEERFRDTDQRFKETEQRFRETDQQIKNTDRRLDRLFRRMERAIEKMSQKVDQTSERVDKLTGKWGAFVEGLVIPGVLRLFKDRGIELEYVSARAKRTLNGHHMEIDILAHNEEYAVVIEAKSTLTVEDVREHLETLKNFKIFFPQFKNHKVLGAVAGIVIEENADRFAYKNGLFVIGQTGDTVKILNDSKFKPRVW
ncbi:MAG: DUF3782 domain-containing protein [Calditrichaeota bacterium]|nr:MAG: DUF3782 domain-containing protein [Calditrichota bacterium]